MVGETKDKRFVILGAGPAGMGAAWELSKRGAKHVVVLDKNDRVGGLARTEKFQGYFFDVGPHRMMTKYAEVEDLWKKMLGKDLLVRPRITRIYYRGRFFQYPLKMVNALYNLGLIQSMLAGASFLKAQLVWRNKEPKNFAEWTTKTFGNRISKAFFRDYTKKVWGIEADEVGVDWAGQRIKPIKILDVFGELVKSMFTMEQVKNIGAQFFYPRYGAGMFYEKMQQELEVLGVKFLLNSKIIAVRCEESCIRAVTVETAAGREDVEGDVFISSIPSNLLVASMTPPASKNVLELTKAMRFRAHIVVNMIIKRKDLFEDSWFYIQSTDVRIARIGNYGQFSSDMLADPNTSAIGIEFFCYEGDEFWNKKDDELIELALREMTELGLVRHEEFGGAYVIRSDDAYPTYYMGYREKFAALRAFLEQFQNLRLIGRAGMYKYKDQDHAMYTGMLTVRNLFGEHHDVWELGEEQEFFEEKTVSQTPKK
jgi:protoporphyrinogen oxidase